ncbi:23S rRNA (adenine(2030)-N(6))-methyltransferase RlmJ [Tanticharoenia sakaeratensis]|uniref:Ribosomal RNA large subunit methyltransferase J n=1 Tax=Tanticharoenia sakaeratensis NBRC 103193 TaxID=1231623 RepID=A0A0D6MKE5_9PROT|nr:23S rRNA (adenine(2030)-N(6))-methyltransferase RlmJ [Tanticharoenia sakaeratensis]GAN53920.1 hypothetical protein Tasa_012_096 [Tanticharoenia sakaeratensis NBRC 103193]GBQ25265.1 hypothetical protein AA103193_3027 [Tanticharoenia sakaeratensis NBRC 103193]
MNYRHAFHAGNFADCMKHALLVALLQALQRKPGGLCVLDTHSGIGGYDLTSGPAERTGEWRSGIGALLDAPPDAALTPYLQIVRNFGAPARYPGSPEIVASLLRPQDRLIACELHPEDAATLRRTMGRRSGVAIHERDGFGAIRALLPPGDLRRGLVLIDPPFERPDDFTRAAQALATAAKRFPGGVLAVWYPIKHRAPVRAFLAEVEAAGLRDVITAELLLREPVDPTRLNGAGLLVVRPPYGFAETATAILDALSRLLAPDADACSGVSRIVDE